MVQLSHATAIATQSVWRKTRKTPYLHNLTVSSILLLCAHTTFVQSAWVEPSDTLNILIMEEPFRAIFRLHTHTNVFYTHFPCKYNGPVVYCAAAPGRGIKFTLLLILPTNIKYIEADWSTGGGRTFS